MAGIAARKTRLSGVDYEPGALVPDADVTRRTIVLGLVSPIPDEMAERLAGDSKPAGSSPTSPFDPSEHTVAEVLDHVDQHPDDAESVLDAELGGKARKTLLDELERRVDVTADEDGEGASDGVGDEATTDADDVAGSGEGP